MTGSMKVHPAIHFIGKNAIRLVLVLVFLGIPAVAFYLREYGIGFGAREALARALSSDSLDVTIGRLALDPFSGLQAKGIEVRSRAEGGRLITTISDTSLSLNLSELTRGSVVVDKLALTNAGVSIPVGRAANAPRLDLTNVRADVILLGDSLRLSRFEGYVEGIRVEVTGQFLNPSTFRSQPPEQGGGNTVAAERILDELAKLHYPGGPPVLRATIDADLADPGSLKVEAFSLRSGAIAGEGWSLRAAEVQGSFERGTLQIPKFLLSDAAGSFNASLECDLNRGMAEGSLLSTLDPKPFLVLAAQSSESLRSLQFRKPPELDAEFSVSGLNGKPAFNVTGAFAAQAVEFRGAKFRNAGLEFAWKEGRLYARDIRVSVGEGVLSGQVWIAPQDIRIQARTTIRPTDLLPLFDPKTREFIERMEFADPPDVEVSLRGEKLDFASLRGQGRLRLGRTAMRGSWLDSAESQFEIGHRCVTYKNFRVATGAGRGTGSFAYDVGLQEARLSEIRSTLVPYDVLMWIDPKIAEAVKPYRFRTPPSATVQGKVHLKDATKNDLAIGIESAGGLEYDLLGKTLRFGKTSAKVDVIGTKVRADIRRAALMGGNVELKALVSIDDKDPTFGADVKMSRVNFAQLTKLYFDYDDSKGVMSGSYKFQARMGQENLMTGSGSIRVEDGNVFAIPVLGPFSDILGGLLPGAGYQTARLATADFTAADEIINTRNLVIEGAGFSMFGAGDISFMTSQLDMSMRINARGIPGIVFYPVSKLFEYVSTGTVADPQWRPKLIPRMSGSKGSPPKPSPR